MAVGLLRSRLAAAGVDATVSSAGLVTVDRPASDHGVTAMASRGIDISDHRSRYLDRQQLEAADLVLCMERQHVREAVVLLPDAFQRTFTVPELARRARDTGPRLPDEAVDVWLRRLGAGRTTRDLLGGSSADEVADPYGGTKREYERTAVELEELIDTIVEHLHPARVA